MGTTKKYWKGLEELTNDSSFVQAQQNEFSEYVPVEKFLENESLKDTSTSRRDFLKLFGFSVTAATLAACEAPVNKAIPYVMKPEEVTPGVANWYASTFYDGNDYCSVLVKTREGRPIKIEGNELSPVTKGGVNARVHASVLSLYDNARLRGPYAAKAPTTWAAADKEIGAKLAAIAAKGGNIRILSSTIISPTTKQVIAEFAAKYPNTKHVTYDAVSYSAIINANSQSFGKSVIPSYSFDKADVIVSIGADFLSNWLSPIEFAKQYSAGRKVGKNKKQMSKHYQFESILSLTGSNADYRYPVKPSQQGAVLLNLYNAVAKLIGGSVVTSSPTAVDKQIEKVAKALVQSKGRSLVVCGSNDVAVQIVVNGLNSLLNNYGKTIDIEKPSFIKQGNDEQFIALVNEMKDGKVDALITYNTNPVYTSPASIGFAAAYNKVGLKISLADRLDETAALADYVCPDHHYLESWNDAYPTAGNYSLSQPTISPLFAAPRNEGTRCAQETLLLWSGNNTDYYTYLKNYWASRVFPMQGKYMSFTEFWNHSLHNGVVEVGYGDKNIDISAIADSTTAPKEPNANSVNTHTVNVAAPGLFPQEIPVEVKENKMSVADAAQVISKASKGGAWELVLYEKTGIGNGSQANNPWLQELPDPISKVTWDNYIAMNPADMKEKGFNTLERYNQMEMKADTANVTVGGVTIELPVFPQPGQARGTIGIAVGYGRNGSGKCGDNIGKNVFSFAQVVNGNINFNVHDATVSEKTGNQHQMACTQTHHTMMGRTIVKETDFTTYSSHPKDVWNEQPLIHTHNGAKPPKQVNLWNDHEKLGHRWGMSIDLNACIGCAACIVSCNAENNVPVVGKEEVRRSREMHWIRIDRYYTSDMTPEKADAESLGVIDKYLEMENPTEENPKVVFQPVMCMHCNHAPCETVCPVLATNSSDEGLNQMTYNRCVGTRYCANNCPYKVRRFNWFNYQAHQQFTDVNPMQNDLGRMVLNPDVVVRSRGVMEKCSMCVQRIQEGKLNAKKAMTKLEDGAIQTACSKSCPTNAITFGDLNNAESMITKEIADDRTYYLLEEIGIQPSVSYLTKVRNLDAEDVAPIKQKPAHHNDGEHKEENKKEETHS